MKTIYIGRELPSQIVLICRSVGRLGLVPVFQLRNQKVVPERRYMIDFPLREKVKPDTTVLSKLIQRVI